MTRDPVQNPQFGDVFHWPDDPDDEVVLYLGSEPDGGWIVLWLNREYGEPHSVDESIQDWRP